MPVCPPTCEDHRHPGRYSPRPIAADSKITAVRLLPSRNVQDLSPLSRPFAKGSMCSLYLMQLSRGAAIVVALLVVDGARHVDGRAPAPPIVHCSERVRCCRSGADARWPGRRLDHLERVMTASRSILRTASTRCARSRAAHPSSVFLPLLVTLTDALLLVVLAPLVGRTAGRAAHSRGWAACPEVADFTRHAALV